MERRRPTIKDVARHAGVSFKTVSRVINGQRGVSGQVEARVRAAIAELGYVVNYSARSLAQGASGVMGIIIPRVTDPRSLDLIYHVGEAAERAEIPIAILSRTSIDPASGVGEIIGHGFFGSLMVMGPRSVNTYLPIIRALNIPTVVVESLMDGEAEGVVPCVASDNLGGARRGVEYLVGLGHQRIAYIAGNDSYQNRKRQQGYAEALCEAGLDTPAEYVRVGRWSWQGGHEQVLELMQLPQPPTAVFCANDTMALGAMCALRERGLNVPADISVLGFDDIPAAWGNRPALTTVRQPTAEMVELAFDLLRRAREGEEIPAVNHVLPTELILRASCAAPEGAAP
ncbi:MAG: LacI family DNA-binding transcriptional regulator [Anaerolineae bacterium]|jgi:LacI family transcriptional regulator|nr:LacI family transcriptional regulator [Chloroflexota bacterium]